MNIVINLIIHVLILYTVKFFVEVTHHLLKQPGMKYVFSEHFCQDPLESFLGDSSLQVVGILSSSSLFH